MSSRFSTVDIRHFLFARTVKTAIALPPMLRSG